MNSTGSASSGVFPVVAVPKGFRYRHCVIEIGTLGRPPGPPHGGPRPGPRPRRPGRTVVIGGGYWPGYPYDRDVEVFTPAVAIRWRVEVTGARQRYYEAPTLGQALRSVPRGARVVGAQRWNGAGWTEV